MKIVFGKYLLLLLLYVFGIMQINLLCAQTKEINDYVIANVNIIDVKNGDTQYNQYILVSDGLIKSIGDFKVLELSNVNRIIDAKGKYAIPGLWDMHAHMRGDNLPSFITTEWLMPLYIANGVTGVRDMTSSCENIEKGPVCLDQMKDWQTEIINYKLLGPRLLALSSYKLNPPWNKKYSRKDVENLVNKFAEQKVDLIKTYFRLSPKVFGWVSHDAKKHGIAVGGHIPIRMSVSEASRKGLRSLEHARDLLFDGFYDSKKFRKSAISQDPSIELMHDMVDHYDSSLTAKTFKIMNSNNTWYVPTHVTRKMEAFADEIDFRNDARNKFIPNMLLEAWNSDADRVIDRDSSKYGRDAYRKFYEKGLEVTGEAKKAGVKILVGTDGGDSFVYPGFAVHDEMEELTKAGLTPLESLRAATIDAAKFLKLSDHFGSIEPGKNADILILNANPLNDINHTKDISALIFRGKHLDRVFLDNLLKKSTNIAF